MDTDSPVPAKRLRTTLNGSIQLTECVREFKLPRQFPSMVSRVTSDQRQPNAERNKTRVVSSTSHGKIPVVPRIPGNPEVTGVNGIVRRIKLKGKDGRDLGELNVQHLTHDIQGKTITIAKNCPITAPEAVGTSNVAIGADFQIQNPKSKGITIGVLTPVNILRNDGKFQAGKLQSTNIQAGNLQTTNMQTINLQKANLQTANLKTVNLQTANLKTVNLQTANLKTVNLQTANLEMANSSSLTQVSKDERTSSDTAGDSKKMLVAERNQTSTAQTDRQGRPQVLVFQSGKNWHMVKIGANARSPQSSGTVAPGKLAALPASEEIAKRTIDKESVEKGGEKSNGKTWSINQSGTIVGCWQKREMHEVEKRSSRAAPASDARESRPRIDISRVTLSPASQVRVGVEKSSKASESIKNLGTKRNSASTAQFRVGVEKSWKPPESVDNLGTKSNSASMTVQLTVGPEKSWKAPESVENLGTKSNLSLRQDVMVVMPSEAIPVIASPDETTGEKSVTSSIGDNSRISSDDFLATRTTARKNREAVENDEISSSLNILTKALSTVEDRELRARALKALADCGIGIERLVPIPSQRRSVKNSDTQTAIFGLVEPEHFVHVTPENPAVERIRPIERKSAKKIGHIVGNPHPQELSLNGADEMNFITPETCGDLTAIVEDYLTGNEGAIQVRDMFTAPQRVPNKLVRQLEHDFQTYNKYDEHGLLGIHRAVIDDDLRTVDRLIKVLKACNESPDLPTADGETSLELAVRFEVSPKIVRALLDFGANPTSTDRDSALIIASKKSLPILKDLVGYVTSRKSLDNYDTAGFSALHYCAQYNNKSGVVELTNAKADINVRDRRSGRTPLFHAIENEHIELAQLLLDKGAQANIACYSGHTVFALVEEGKHFSLAESLNRAGK